MASWRDNIRQVEPYVPGEQPKNTNVIKLNTNENPYGPSPRVKAVQDNEDLLRLYPDPTAGRAVRKADKPPEEVINFRRAMKLMSVICHVRILGKVTVVDDKGRRW